MLTAKRKCSLFICLFLLAFLLAVFSYFIVKDAALIFGDDRQFLDFLEGKEIIRGWTGVHRFWPFGLADYNILSIFPKFRTITCLYVFNVIIMLSMIGILFKLCYEIAKDKTKYAIEVVTIVLISLLMSSNFLNIHIEIIFPERFMIFVFAIFMAGYFYGIKNQSTSAYCIAVFAATYATYCKEPVFGLIAIIALTNLILGRKILSQKDKLFNIALLINSIVFLGIYFFVTLDHTSDSYSRLLGWGIFTDTKNAFKDNLYIFIILGFGIVRSYWVVLKKDVSDLFYDSLLFAGCGYILAFFVLKLFCGYYFIPSIVLALPTVTKYLGIVFNSTSRFWKLFSSLIILAPAFQSVIMIPNLIESRLYSRKVATPQILHELVNCRLRGNNVYLIKVFDCKESSKNSYRRTFFDIFDMFMRHSDIFFESNETLLTLDEKNINNLKDDDIAIFVLNKPIKNFSRRVVDLLKKNGMSSFFYTLGSIGYKKNKLYPFNGKLVYNFSEEKEIDKCPHIGTIGILKSAFTKEPVHYISVSCVPNKSYNITMNIESKIHHSVSIDVNGKNVFNNVFPFGKTQYTLKVDKSLIKEDGIIELKFVIYDPDDSGMANCYDDMLYDFSILDIAVEECKD